LTILAMLFIVLTLFSQAGWVLKQAIHWSISADWLDRRRPVFQYLPICLYISSMIRCQSHGRRLLFALPCGIMDVSPDARVYEFRLRKGVKFHNGDALTPKTSCSASGDTRRPRQNDSRQNGEGGAVNPYLVRIRFKDSFPDFLEYLIAEGARLRGWSEKLYRKGGDAGYKKNPVGCGPTNSWNLYRRETCRRSL